MKTYTRVGREDLFDDLRRCSGYQVIPAIFLHERLRDEIEGQDENVDLNDTKDEECHDIRFFRTVIKLGYASKRFRTGFYVPLWTVAQSKDELQYDESEINVLQQVVNNG